MKFNGITKKGREYLAKIQAENKPINFSKIKIGDGRLDNYDNPAELEHLINQKVEKGILTLNQEHDTVILTTNIDNVSLRTGYYPREIGVFVNDNGQEIMYYYMNDGDETSWIPPETDGPFKIELKLNLIASNAQSIVVEGPGKELYITKEFLETNYTQKGGYTGTAQEIDDRVVSALGKEDGKFPLTEAVKGNVYYFPGNKKFYICKEAQNRRVSVPDGNFEELSIWENRKRLENLLTKYGNFTTDNNKISGNISLNFKNNSNDVLNQKFSITENGLYFISATQRVTNTREESESVTITINSNVVTRHDFNIPVVSSRRETNVTITTVAYLTTTDVVNVTRSHCDYVCRQRDLFILKLSN
uniref:Tail-collar fiber protein n=2 Tax=unclassified Caudoviricetes TaxID=2788787 RepID=A0A8S5QUP9_9CAUD|nr:MAG TPA: tail-collar fiber protein [Caudovirales sp. ctmZz45]DAF89040.1 MAG TPA: tail-collar fiber protein [Caudovirales sp. ctMof18]